MKGAAAKSLNPVGPSPDSTSIRPKVHQRDRRRSPPESSDEAESWLISYADLMTLLFGFFVMLQSFSTLDSQQFEKIKMETSQVFGGEYRKPFEELTGEIAKAVKEHGLDGQVLLEPTDSGLVITFRGAFFFDSGSVLIKNEAANLMATVVPIIESRAKEHLVEIEGHTDSTPIAGGLLASNWELSSVRACSVLRIFEEKGFDRRNLRAVGWADTKPIVSEKDKDGNYLPEMQAQNRRVVIKVMKNSAAQGPLTTSAKQETLEL